jgi:hypothetical protein
MDKEHIKGAADKAKGAVKDAAGKMMDDKGLQAEGKMDKAKGEARLLSPGMLKGRPPGRPFLSSSRRSARQKRTLRAGDPRFGA